MHLFEFLLYLCLCCCQKSSSFRIPSNNIFPNYNLHLLFFFYEIYLHIKKSIWYKWCKEQKDKAHILHSVIAKYVSSHIQWQKMLLTSRIQIKFTSSNHILHMHSVRLLMHCIVSKFRLTSSNSTSRVNNFQVPRLVRYYKRSDVISMTCALKMLSRRCFQETHEATLKVSISFRRSRVVKLNIVEGNWFMGWEFWDYW